MDKNIDCDILSILFVAYKQFLPYSREDGSMLSQTDCLSMKLFYLAN